MKNRAIMIDTNAISRLMLGDETVDTLVDKIRAFESEHPELAEVKESHA